MNAELQRIYDSVPAEKSRSRLEPYRELILQWRRQGRSYRRIRTLLAEKCHIEIAYEPLRRFVKRRSRPRKVQAEAVPTDQPAAPMKYNNPSSDEVAKQRALIQDLRNKPVVVREVRKRFVYDPDEPLILEKKKQES